MNSKDYTAEPTVKIFPDRPFQGIVAGALAGTGAAVLAELIDNLVFHAGARSTLISPLVPLGVLALSGFVFLPIVWFVLKIVPKRLSLFFPSVVLAACCAVYIVLFPGDQTRLMLLGISTFIYVLLIFLAASVVAAWVWIRPEPRPQ